jgi:hypothetical protein
MSRFATRQVQDRNNSYLIDVSESFELQAEAIWGWSQESDWDHEETEVLELDGPVDDLFGFSIR